MSPSWTGLVLLASLLVAIQAKGDLNDFNSDKQTISPERIAQYFTDTVIQGKQRDEMRKNADLKENISGVGKAEQKCSDRVFQSRQAAQENGKEFSLGVQPTVGLGAALLIFLGVGVFAAGIAQAFQLVSTHTLSHDISREINQENSNESANLIKLISS